MSKEKDTLPDWERMFEVLTNIQTQVQETNQRLERIENRVEEGFEQIRRNFVFIEVRLEKVEALANAEISVSKYIKSEVMLLREEFNAQLIANFGKPKPDPLFSL